MNNNFDMGDIFDELKKILDNSTLEGELYQVTPEERESWAKDIATGNLVVMPRTTFESICKEEKDSIGVGMIAVSETIFRLTLAQSSVTKSKLISGWLKCGWLRKEWPND